MSIPLSPDEPTKQETASQNDAAAVAATEKPKRKKTATVKPTARAQRGAICVNKHVERTLIIYPLLEEEMDALALLNTASTALFSIGSGLLMFCVGLFFDLEIQSTVSETVAKEVHILQWVCIPAGIGCWIFGGISAYKRRTKLQKLKTEAQRQQAHAN